MLQTNLNAQHIKRNAIENMLNSCVIVLQCIITAGETFCRPRRDRVAMADNSDEVVPASLQCGICSQLCKRGVKVLVICWFVVGHG